VLETIREYGGIEYARKRAQDHIDKAQKSLDIFQASETRILLEQLADYVLIRKM
jgi:geranylgeranyl pyrophosphate synthase